jgi:hypothetical protein
VVEGVVFIAAMEVDGWPLISGPDYSEQGQGRLWTLHVINFGSTMTAFAAAYSYNISTTSPIPNTPIHTQPNMPMPGADKTTEAKEGALTYMRAWGGTSLNSSIHTRHQPN